MTEREETGEVLLGSPEFVAWLERLRSESEFGAGLEPHETEDEGDEGSSRAA